MIYSSLRRRLSGALSSTRRFTSAISRAPIEYFLCHILRNLSVVLQFHRKRPAPLSRRAQVRRISEHIRQRHVRANRLHAPWSWFHAFDLTTACREIADHVAGIFVG